MKRRASLLFILIFLTLISCGKPPEFLSGEEYAKWISSHEHGFVREKKVNGVTLQSRYLPAAYLAYREYKNEENRMPFDSIYNEYHCGLTFQFTLQADKTNLQYNSLKNYNINSKEEMTERSRLLNFSTQELFSLDWKEQHYLPVMSAFEGFNELENKLTFIVVFQVAEFKCGSPDEDFDEVNLLFNDPIWGLGINHFVFEKSVFGNKPKLKI